MYLTWWSQSSEARCILEEPVDWADGLVVVYDISDRTSFIDAQSILRQIREARTDNCKGWAAQRRLNLILLWWGNSTLLQLVACYLYYCIISRRSEAIQHCKAAGTTTRFLVYIHIYIYMYIYIYIYIHDHSKVWGHLEMSLFFKEKHCFFNKDNINQKHTIHC